MKIINKIIFKLKIILIRRTWKIQNKHNSTWLGTIGNSNFLDFIWNEGVSVGCFTYGRLNINYTGNKNEKLIIGNYCSIATSSLFILGGEHDYRTFTTYPAISRIGKYETEVLTKGTIQLDDEVWIGDNATILSGVKIGKGAVVAAGSVVTRDIPPYAIAGGNPAKVIKYRFSSYVINRLMQYKLIITDINSDIKNLLSIKISDQNINIVIEELERKNVIKHI